MGEESPASRRATALALVFAMAFPTLTAWGYFVALSRGGQPSAAQQAAFAAGKVVQLAFPLLFLLAWERRTPDWHRPTGAGLALGLLFGAAVVAGMLALYYGGLRSSSLLAQTPGKVRAKLAEVGVGSPAGFLLLAAGYVAVHSFLEEYYWRWFVFGRLRTLLPLVPALALSSLAFASHHVIVLGVYLPGKVLTGVAPLALAVAVGGGVWAWIYERGRSLLAPWLSHALVDAGIFVIGWDLFRRGG
jgi:membrane protease YdiL (CAAX protease family)